MAYSSNDTLDFSKLDGAADTKSQTITVDGQDTIDLPSSDFTTNATLTKDGADLILEAPDGSNVIVEGYFSADPAPVLQAPNGTALTEQLVDSFAKAPAEFAQNGTLNDESPVGEIEELSGSASVTRNDGSVDTIQIGTPIYEGDIVETSADGAVNIVFADETSFAVSENARMAIDEYVYDPATESGSQNFSVLRGVFVFTSGLIGRDDPDDVEIETPVGSIGIRGTIIAGDINPDGESEITVIEGAIVVTNGAGEAILSEQFETVKIEGFNSEINNIGSLDANTVSSTYNAVKGVSPSLFSAVEDVAGEKSENVERTTSQDETQDEIKEEQEAEESGEEALDAESEETLELENKSENEGERETLMKKINETPETFDGKTKTFDGNRDEALKEKMAEKAEATKEKIAEKIADNKNDDQGDVELPSPEIFVLPETPTDIRNLNNPNAPGVTVISGSGGNRLGSTIASGQFNADGRSDLRIGDDTNNGLHNNYHVNGVGGVITDRNASGTGYSDAPVNGSYADDVLANIGDIDGDGKDDFAQGFSLSSVTVNGQVNIYASAAGDSKQNGGFGEGLGSSISTLGDIDRDGYDDFIVGAENANKAYIGIGNGGSFSYSSGLLNGDGQTGFGASVTSGDFNGDGKMDVAASASGTGKIYVSFGDGAGGFSDGNLFSGVSGNVPIHNLGDVNGDGKTDLLTLSDLGQATVLKGGAAGIESLTESAAALNIIGAGAAGDWNGDGYDDFVLVTQSPAFSDVARFHIVYGGTGLPGTLNEAYLNNDNNAFTMHLNMKGHVNADGLEYNISSAGDLDGDGYDDLVIGTPDYGFDNLGDTNGDLDLNNDNDGRVTIVYGRDTDNNDLVGIGGHSNPVIATANGQTLTGTSTNDTLVDGSDASPYGNLSLNSGAGNDFFGLDARTIASNRIDGGSGIDTIVIEDPSGATIGTPLDFSTIQNIEGIERFWMREGNMEMRLTIDDLFRLFEQSDTDSITFDVETSLPTGTKIILDDLGGGSGSGLAIFSTAVQSGGSGTTSLTDKSGGAANELHEITIGNNTLYIDDTIALEVV